MNPYEGKYVIDKIRNLSDGSMCDNETWLRGKLIRIYSIEIAKILVIHVNDENSVITSLVKEVKDYDDYLQVYTLNTLYQFKKVVG